MLTRKGQTIFVIKTIVSVIGLGIVLGLAIPASSYAADAVTAIAGQSSESGEIGSPSPSAPTIQQETKQLAEDILNCNQPDPTRGAKFFVGPTAFPAADESHERYIPPTEAAEGHVDFFAGLSGTEEADLIQEKLNEYSEATVIDALTIDVNGVRWYTAWWANYNLDQIGIDNTPRERICIENSNPDAVRFYKDVSGSGTNKQCSSNEGDAPVQDPDVCSTILNNADGDSSSLTDIDQNIKHLAIIIETEAGLYVDQVTDNIRRAVGYTVLHRMADQGTTTVKDTSIACKYDGWIEYYNADESGYCQRGVG